MWDEDEVASPTPCHVRWVVRRTAELEVEGHLDVDLPGLRQGVDRDLGPVAA